MLTNDGLAELKKAISSESAFAKSLDVQMPVKGTAEYVVFKAVYFALANPLSIVMVVGSSILEASQCLSEMETLISRNTALKSLIKFSRASFSTYGGNAVEGGGFAVSGGLPEKVQGICREKILFACPSWESIPLRTQQCIESYGDMAEYVKD